MRRVRSPLNGGLFGFSSLRGYSVLPLGTELVANGEIHLWARRQKDKDEPTLCIITLTDAHSWSGVCPHKHPRPFRLRWVAQVKDSSSGWFVTGAFVS